MSSQQFHKLRAQKNDYDLNGIKFTPYRASEYRRAFFPAVKQPAVINKAPVSKAENYQFNYRRTLGTSV